MSTVKNGNKYTAYSGNRKASPTLFNTYQLKNLKTQQLTNLKTQKLPNPNFQFMQKYRTFV